jgi:uncharacterized membrane protein YidH (DUF202 family)
MKSATLVGLLLIVLGIGALVYQGVSYKSQEKILDIGSLEATAETTKTIPISPIVGVIAVVSGVAVVIATGRKDATA